MPEHNGLEVVGILAGLGYTVPLLIVTALSVTLDSAGGHALLAKPFTPRDLQEKVREVLSAPM